MLKQHHSETDERVVRGPAADNASAAVANGVRLQAQARHMAALQSPADTAAGPIQLKLTRALSPNPQEPAAPGEVAQLSSAKVVMHGLGGGGGQEDDEDPRKPDRSKDKHEKEEDEAPPEEEEAAEEYEPEQDITTGKLTTSATHIKGNKKGRTKSRKGRPGRLRTQSSAAVIKRAQSAIEGGSATHLGTTGNDEVYEVPRQDPRSTKAPRRFHVHRGGGDGSTRGVFEVANPERDADSQGEFSESEVESRASRSRSRSPSPRRSRSRSRTPPRSRRHHRSRSRSPSPRRHHRSRKRSRSRSRSRRRSRSRS
ncbi:hypothetical protein [Ideonella sp.]|uniref:hypothetical protein n=1 Tax=Ideonella sp. TaxID=1929293 RepID=UPI0035B47969